MGMQLVVKSYFKSFNMMCFILLVPLFAFFTLILVRPYGLVSFFGDQVDHFAFIAAIFGSIILVNNLIFRLLMLLGKDTLSQYHYKYMLMQALEIISSSMFCTLFAYLITGAKTPYFSMLPTALMYTIGFLIWPYVIISLVAQLQDRSDQIEELNDLVYKYSSGQIGANDSPIHFLDSSNKLKLLVRADTILYVEAADNYVNICYLHAGKMARYALRNTMSGVEQLCLTNSLVRCHRSYFVNLKKVRIIERGSDGMFAELDYQGAPHIPVSKTYAKQVVETFSSLIG